MRPGRAAELHVRPLFGNIMTKSNTASAIAYVSKFAYANGLKAEGFKRMGNHFVKPSADLFHGINFQASQWGSMDEGSFTINLVVTSAAVYELWTEKPLPRNPASALFPMQHRIGSLMPQRRDHWWTVSAKTDLDALAREVTEVLTVNGLPFFAEYPDSKALLDRLRAGKALPGLSEGQCALVHAMLAHILGLDDEAAVQIQNLLAETDVFGFRTNVLRVAKRIGVL